MNTCGNCSHAKVIKDDLTKRTCKGAPPQLILMPSAMGQLALVPMFPNVTPADEACGAFKPKPIQPEQQG